MNRFAPTLIALLALFSCSGTREKKVWGDVEAFAQAADALAEEHMGSDSTLQDEFSAETTARIKPKNYSLEVVKEYPHDDRSYTQGLFFHDGKLYESTGLYGHSRFMEVDLASGEALREFKIKDKYFAEGSVILNGELFILTWESGLVFVYDASSFKYLRSHSFPHEGWGLTTDGKQLIASDGSDKLYFMDEQCKIQRTVNVKNEGRKLEYLNELEYIDGKVWANVYTADMVAIIDPESGIVEGIIDCSGLLPESLREKNWTDVQNGIAYNPNDGKLYFTGKRWKRLYEVKLIEKTGP